MTDLTEAQRLRVAAALSQHDRVIWLDRKQALALAHRMEEFDRSMDIRQANEAQRQREFDSLQMWWFRTIAIISAVQAIAWGVMASW